MKKQIKAKEIKKETKEKTIKQKAKINESKKEIKEQKKEVKPKESNSYYVGSIRLKKGWTSIFSDGNKHYSFKEEK